MPARSISIALLLALAAPTHAVGIQRRVLLQNSAAAVTAAVTTAAMPALASDGMVDRTGVVAGGGGAVKMDGLNGVGKPKTIFPDFESTKSGLQYKDYKPGSGAAARTGDRVSLEWTGVTVGYQGRYFQARNKPKGGAFEGDGFLDEPLAFTVGDGSIVPGVDEAVRGMAVGSVRRVLVPEELGYPADGFKTVGPFPSTFSGQRALGFVLSSKQNMMDKTLMFDLKMVSIRPAGK